MLPASPIRATQIGPSRLRRTGLVRGGSLYARGQLAALVAAMLVLASFCWDGSLASAQQPSTSLGAVLLKNDRVITGVVEPRGDSFVVFLAETSQITLAKSQVQYVGRSVEDLYAYKRRLLVNPNTGDHFKMTRWCMANQLLDHAVDHYELVVKQSGSHPRVKQLGIELKNQLLEVPDFRNYLGLPPITVATAVSAHEVQVDETRSGVELTSHAAKSPSTPPHPQVVERFGERIQPILINRCSQIACHGGQSNNALRLIEPHSKFYARTSSENLRSVLQHVSPAPESVSPLLAYATQTHGLQREPAISITETALVAELAAWVAMVQNPVVSAEGFSIDATPSSPATLMAVEPGAARLKQVPRAGLPGGLERIAFPRGEMPPTFSELEALERQFDQLPPDATHPPAEASNSRDPFDPTEFNRRAQSRSAD